MNDRPHVEWRGRADFAEIAEALGVDTDAIMAVHSSGIVMWTDGDDTIWRAQLGRGFDEVIIVGPRRAAGTVADLKDAIDDAVARAMGESPNRG